MTIILQCVIYFAIMSVLFLLMAVTTGHKIKVLIFYTMFLTLSYVGISGVLGYSKPVSALPFYEHVLWDDDTVYVVGGYWTDDTIYLLLKEKETIMTYSWPMSPEFLDRLKQAQEAMMKSNADHDRWGFKLKVKSIHRPVRTDIDSYPHIQLPDPVMVKEVVKDIVPDNTVNVTSTDAQGINRMGFSMTGVHSTHSYPQGYMSGPSSSGQTLPTEPVHAGTSLPSPVVIEKVPDVKSYSGYDH